MTGEFIIRIFIAGVLGGLIGLEREYRAKEAGIRTHFLVALGSALFMIISQYGFEGVTAGRFDVSRVAAQVVTGIGFIGAGTIIFQKNAVRGLTTAAGLWVTAAIGMACGGGLYVLAAVASIIVLIILEAMHFVLEKIGEKQMSITCSAECKESILDVLNELKSNKLNVESYTLNSSTTTPTVYKASFSFKVPRSKYEDILRTLMTNLKGVTIESME